MNVDNSFNGCPLSNIMIQGNVGEILKSAGFMKYVSFYHNLENSCKMMEKCSHGKNKVHSLSLLRAYATGHNDICSLEGLKIA